MPKKHGKDIFELDIDTVAKAHAVAKRTAEAVKKAMNADGVNILQNNGEAAWQSVSHYHIHVIPRHKGDWPAFPGHTSNVTDDEQKEICAKIAKEVK